MPLTNMRFTITRSSRGSGFTILLLLILAGQTIQVVAQEPSLTPHFSPVLDANINGFWRYLPRDYDQDQSKRFPLLVYIHGAGDQGSSADVPTLQRVLRRGPGKLINLGSFPESFTVNGENFRFIVLSPQIKNGVTGVTSTINPATIDAVVEYAKEFLRVDTTRIYVIGMSMGGGGTWDYAGSISGSRKLAAVVVAAGAADLSDDQAERIAAEKVAVLATHNTVDNIVLSARTNQNIAEINSHSSILTPTPKKVLWNSAGANDPMFNDANHNVWSRTFEDIQPGTTTGGNLTDTLGENVYEWLLKHTKISDAVIPVQWMSFMASSSDLNIQLRWTVSDEVNVNRYSIEKSSDGKIFTEITSLPFDESKLGEYAYTDDVDVQAVTYYRITQFGHNGNFSYSPVRKVELAAGKPIQFAIYPNPIQDVIYFHVPATLSQRLSITIHDVSGRLHRSSSQTFTGNPVSMSGLGELAKGLYSITISEIDGTEFWTGKFLKK